jgi:mannose-1-phosphate guanylyltransferase
MSLATEVAAQGVITTIGIVPTRPETGYGYIRSGEARGAGAFHVEGFFEKPDLSTAERYVDSGDYFWNAGIFVFRARDMKDAVARHLPQMTPHLEKIDAQAKSGAAAEQAAVAEFFHACESISIDYGVMEKEPHLAVVPGDFGWSDLGSWESAWELSAKDEAGNAAPAHVIFVDGRDNLVEDLRTDRTKEKTIALIGVEGLCVVETDDALLVMPRERSQDVREAVRRLTDAKKDSLV